MKIYISGRITGVENFEDRFKEAELKLRKEYPDAEIVNPIIIGKEVEEQIINPTWNDYMRNCIKHLVECDSIYLLDDWKNSKGARLEYFIASCLDYSFVEM